MAVRPFIFPDLSRPISERVTPAPLAVGSPLLWTTSDYGITKDGSDLIEQWDDKSGNANHLTQATSGKKPLYVANQINGYPAVRFNQSGKSLAIPSIAQATGSIYIVGYQSSGETGYRVGMNRDTSGGGPPYPPAIYFSTSGNDNKPGIYWNDGIKVQYGTAVTGWHLFTFKLVTATQTGSIGIDNGSFTNASSFPMPTSTWTKLVDDAVQQWGGDIAEVIIYNEDISAAEHTDLLNYFQSRYAIW